MNLLTKQKQTHRLREQAYGFGGKDTCTPTFIAALFTKAKTCRQPKCPSTGMDKVDVVHIYNGLLLSC